MRERRRRPLAELDLAAEARHLSVLGDSDESVEIRRQLAAGPALLGFEELPRAAHREKHEDAAAGQLDEFSSAESARAAHFRPSLFIARAAVSMASMILT